MRTQQAGDRSNPLAAFSDFMDRLFQIFVGRGKSFGETFCLLDEDAPKPCAQLLIFF